MIKFLILSILVWGQIAFADKGGWEGSGGDGVACWPRIELAKQAEEEIKENGFISKALKNQITSLEVLEYWENKNAQGFAYLKDYKTIDEVLIKVDKLLEKHSPLFASRLKLVRKKIPFNSWVHKSEIKDISDSHPAKKIKEDFPKCRLVQLAARYSKSNGTEKLPEVYIQYDVELFKKLNPFNQAILILHEEMYLIAKETGHDDSDDIRFAVAMLASNQFEIMEVMGSSTVEVGRSLQAFLGRFYGDYVRFFWIDDPNVNVKANSQYSRYQSFLKSNLMLRKEIGHCLKEQTFDTATELQKRNIVQFCQTKILHDKSLLSELNEEEAFVFLGRYVLQNSRLLVNSEQLLAVDFEQIHYISGKQKEVLKLSCHYLNEEIVESEAWESLRSKALTYCKNLEF